MKSDKTICLFSAVFSLLVIGYVACFSLIIQNWHTDNLYNLGMIRRSLLPSARSLLETSYLHWYFDAYEPVRPEDWHRGLSLLMLRGLGRLAGSAELLFRFVHFVWVCSWLTITALLARHIACSLSDRETHDVKKGLLPFFALSGILLILSTWANPILTAAYLDDLPAAVCALGGIRILLAERLGYREMVAAGGAIGLSLWMKDLYLIWLLIGPVVVIAVILMGQRRTLAEGATLVALFTVTMFLVFAPKLAWNYHDLGKLLPDAARLGLKARLLRSVLDGEHQPWFLFPEVVLPKSHWQLMKSQVVVHCLSQGWRNLTEFYATTWGTWTWSTVACCVAVLHRNRSSALFRAIIISAIITLSYTSIFVMQIAEPGQVRYWLVPLSFVVSAGAGVLPSVQLEMQRRTIGSGVLCGFLFIAVVGLITSASMNLRNVQRITGHSMPYSHDVEKAFHAVITPGSTGLVETNRGVHYWQHYPEESLVSVKSNVAISLPPEKFVELLNHYRVSAALVEDAYLETLLQLYNFTKVYGDGDVAVLVRQPVNLEGKTK